MTLRPLRSALPLSCLGSWAVLAQTLLLAPITTYATTIYWDTNGASADSSGGATANGTWDLNATGNWSLDAAGLVGTSDYATAHGGSPATADVIFSAGANATGASTITLTAVGSTGVTARGITIEEGAIVTATSGTFTGPVLTLGTGGLTIAATSAGASSLNSNTTVGLLGNQSWTNNGASLFTASGGITSLATSGTTTLTLATTAAGGVTLGGIVGDGTSGARIALTAAGPGVTTISGANTYTGGTTINAGATVTTTVAGALGSLALNTPGVTNNGTLNLAVGNVTHSGLATAMGGNGIVNVTLGTGANTNALNGNYSAFTGVWNVGIGAAAGAGKVQMNGLDNAAATINLLTNSTLFTNGVVTHNAAIVLNGGDTGESMGQLRVESGAIWAGPVTIAGALTTPTADSTVGSNAGIGTISGPIGETGGSKNMVKGGPGTIVLSGPNNWTGKTSIINGVLSVGQFNNVVGGTASSHLGAPSSVANGTIDIGNAATAGQLIYTGNGETTDRVINLAGTTGAATLTQSGLSGNLKLTNAFTATGAGAKTLTLQGSTAGTGEIAGAIVNSSAATSLTKSGTGTWTLGGTNSFTGATTINGGTLRLDYATNSTTKLADGAALTLTGGTVELVGGSHIEVVSATTLTAGTVNFVSRSGGGSVLRMNAITNNGATVTFNGNGIADTDTANTNGILGPWARMNLAGVSSWATNSGGLDGAIVAYTAYTDVARLFNGTPAGTIPNAAANNVRIIESGTTGNITLAGGALTQANSLQLDASGGPAVIAPTAATDVLNLGNDTGGGIWQTAGAGALTIGTAPNDGVLTTGATANATAATLNISTDSATNAVTVNSLIQNNGTDAVGISKSGNGTLILNGNNTYTGVTTVGSGTGNAGGGGTLVLTGNNTAVTGNTLVGNGATVQLQSTNALGNTGVTNSQLILFNGSNLQLRADTTLTFNGTNGTGGLNGAVVGIDVNRLTGAGIGQTLTASPGISAMGNAVTINVTGGNGYNLAMGTFQSVTGAASNLTINPTTANVSIVGFQQHYTAANTNAATLTLSGTATGNSVSGVIANQSLTSLATGIVSLTKLGSSTWTLNGANTYTGTTLVTEGILNLAGNRTVTSGAITVGNSPGLNATLNISNGNWSLGATNLTLASNSNNSVVNQTGGSVGFTGGTQLIVGNGTPGTLGTYNLSAGTLTGAAVANRGIILGTNTGTSGVFNLSGTGNLTMSTSTVMVARSDDAVTNTTTGTFTQSGTSTAAIGTLTVGGGQASSFNNNGTLTLTGGTFVATNFTAMAVGSNSTANLTFGGTAQVTLPAFPTVRGAGSTATLTFDGGTLIPGAPSASYISGLTSATITNNGAKFDVTNNITIPQVFGNAPAQSGPLTKKGAGTLTLTGNNTFSGAVSIENGTLEIVAATGLGTGTSAVLLGSSSTPATLKYSGGTGTLARDLNVGSAGGTVSNTGGGNLSLTGILTKNGTNLTLADGQFTVSGQITGPASNSDLIIATGGLATLMNTNNNYNGATVVQSGGTLITGAAGVLPDSSAFTLGGGTLNTGGVNETTGPLSLTGSSIINMAGTSIFTFASDNATPWVGTLSIYNWNGIPGIGGGAEQLLFNSYNGSMNLANVNFYSDNGVTIVNGPGAMFVGNELVAIPEPSSLLLLAASLCWLRRRRN